MHRHPLLIGLAGVAITAVACSSNGSTAKTTTPSPTSTPRAGEAFVSRVDNAWFPLLPGSRWEYVGTKDGEKSREVMTISGETAVINGVRCIVVKDLLYLTGKLEERTKDYYVQDTAGNVWYYGEDTAELDKNGKVTSTEGTWRSGRDGALPGIFMPAQPAVGLTFQQEYLKGHAEDHFKIVDLAARIPVHLAPVQATTAMRTEEWTPLEPNVLDNKYYVQGMGTVLETTVKGPQETNALVSFTPGH